MSEKAEEKRWPRLMRAETAREYVDLGPEVFRREVVPSVPAIIFGGRRHFARDDLDRWIEQKLGRATPQQKRDWLSQIDADIKN